ncbi:PRAME family member 12-like, partial [Marmota marmota marmota]|uniref:PRAME family member 12-like n=1 Tax=Marmota marmota marmota TaxID=9994 RepID=UPI00076230ED
DLPTELFPPLFVEAFSRGNTDVLKKMVQAWPFTHLPLGALMRKPQLPVMPARRGGEALATLSPIWERLPDMEVLVEAVVTHERGLPDPASVCTSGDTRLDWREVDGEKRWKLQVLDLRNVPQNLWRMWSGAVFDACSPEDIKKNRTLKLGPAMADKPPFKVFIDFSLRKRPLDEFLTHFFLCFTQRRDRLHLCCNRLKIFGKPTSHTRKVLRLLQLDSVQKEQEQLLAQLTSQFLRMDCLWKFCANAVFLLEGHLEQVLRHLKTPLETLSITNCPLSDSDWNYLSRYPNTRQLRHLELRGIKLTDFSLEPLQILLHSTATTLNSLDLEACRITDSQLQALMPALSHCSQLVILSFPGNRLSMSTLRDLLLHTARLNQLSVELYPAPLEIYDARGTIHPGRFSQHCAELTAIVRDFRQPNILVFCTVPCHRCGYKFLYNQGFIHCSCPTAA